MILKTKESEDIKNIIKILPTLGFVKILIIVELKNYFGWTTHGEIRKVVKIF